MTKRRYPTRESVSGLVEKLGLPDLSEFSQDWHYEIADPSLVHRLLAAYFADQRLTEDEKFSLMMVIIASINQALLLGEPVEPIEWERLELAIKKDFDLHKSTLDYWAQWGEGDNTDDLFPITPRLRSIIQQQG